MLSCACAWGAGATAPSRPAHASAKSTRLAFITFLPGSILRRPDRPAAAPFGPHPAPRDAAGGNWSYFASLIRKRPHPQFLLSDLPQPRQPGRLDDQEEQDQRADHHE